MIASQHHARLDAAAVKQQAAGRWREIVPALTGIDADLFDGKGHPCPACAGTNRFSAFRDFPETGGVICRHCFSQENGDGLATVAHFRGVEFREAVRLVAEHLGMTPGSARLRSTHAKPHQPRQSTAAAPTFATAQAAAESYTARLGRYDRKWVYTDAHGAPTLVVLRWDAKGDRDKTIRPVSRTADGQWTPRQPDGGRPLLRLPELLATEGTVCVAEGEPAADALVTLGLTATTSSGGSSAGEKSDWSPLAGRDVVILPDNDQPGRKYADTVAGLLSRLAPPAKVRVVELPGLSEGGDAVDWIAAGGTAAELVRLVADAEPEVTPQPERPLAWRPFPVEVLPECLRDYASEVARVVQVDPVAAALPGIVAAGSAIGDSRCVQLAPDWQEPCILWGALVAESGDGKTPAAKPMLAPVRAADAAEEPGNAERLAQYEDDKRVHAADLEAWKAARKKGSPDPPPRAPDPPRLVRHAVSDITPEKLAEVLADNGRLLCDRDELSGLLGGMGRYGDGRGTAERAAYLSIHSAEPIRIDRKTGDRRSLLVESPHLSIYGGVQPGLLHNVLSNDDVAAGLPARFLWASPPAKRQRYRSERVKPATRAAYERAFDALYRLTPAVDEFGADRPLAVRLSAEAERVFSDSVNRLNDRRYEATGPIKGALSKLRGYVGRLALVLHCLRDADGDLPPGDELTIDSGTMRAAATLADWFADEAERVFRQRGESDADRDLRQLAEWIATRGGAVTPRELAQGRRDLPTSADAEAALNRLVVAGYGAWHQTATATKPRREFALSPVAPGVASTSTNSPESRTASENVDLDTAESPETVPADADDLDGWEVP